jgi:phage terminase large subunit-like protein
MGRFKFPNDDKKRVQAAYQAAAPSDCFGFIQGLDIPSASGTKLFRDCMQEFQRDTFQDIAPSLHAIRDGQMPPKRRFWIERTKKASKDGDLGACLLWLTAFPRRPLYIQVGAADRDQAGIVRRRIKDLLHLNSWLNEFVEVQNYKVRHKRGLAEVDILAADAAGAHGETPDLLVLNELSHVTKDEFLENLMDNATGVPRGVVIIATNAGFKNKMAGRWRDLYENDPEWAMHVWNKPSPWLLEQDIAEARRRNSKSRYARLFHGVWSSGKGDALDPDKLASIFRVDIQPMDKREEGWQYISGLDLGVSHDHAGLVVLGIHTGQRRLRIAAMWHWRPPEGGEIDLSSVEEAQLAAHRRFRLHWAGYDPHQAKLMAQRLQRAGVPMREMPFGPANLTLMANTLKQVVESGQLECYPDKVLELDLSKLDIVEKPYGYKLEATSDEDGHADVATALVIALPTAIQILDASMFSADDEIGYDSDPEDDDEIYEEMPQELQDICDAAGPYDEFDD